MPPLLPNSAETPKPAAGCTPGAPARPALRRWIKPISLSLLLCCLLSCACSWASALGSAAAVLPWQPPELMRAQRHFVEDSPFLPGRFAVARFEIPLTTGGSAADPPRPLLVFAPWAQDTLPSLRDGDTAQEASASLPFNPASSDQQASGWGSREGGTGAWDESLPAGNDEPLPAAPLVVFLHGFNLKPQFYSQLLTHWASHGFFVVAPELYGSTLSPDSTEEIKGGAQVILWLRGYLEARLPAGTLFLAPDLGSVCIAGHSRGGKEAYGVALNLSGIDAGVRAVLVLDPVDGTSNQSQTPPPILKHEDDSLKLGAPVLVVGSGLGPLKRLGVLPPCAPLRMGHTFFFSDARPPAYHVRAAEFGHMDMLDDVTGGVVGKLTYALCRNGGAREPMRTFCSGVGVSFLRGVFRNEIAEFEELLLGNSSRFNILVDEIHVKRPALEAAARDLAGAVAAV